ncbi:hypothetical protein Vretifemale_3985, partial [Volvox reticuliferus]
GALSGQAMTATGEEETAGLGGVSGRDIYGQRQPAVAGSPPPRGLAGDGGSVEEGKGLSGRAVKSPIKKHQVEGMNDGMIGGSSTGKRRGGSSNSPGDPFPVATGTLQPRQPTEAMWRSADAAGGDVDGGQDVRDAAVLDVLTDKDLQQIKQAIVND